MGAERMSLSKGAKKCFEWLRTQAAGRLVSQAELMQITGWKPSSLKTYFGKNKLAPFLMPIAGDRIKVLMDGSDVTDRYFHEVFTQTAPPKITLTSGDVLPGVRGRYRLEQPLGRGAVGHVWSARDLSAPEVTLVALKIMLPRQDLLAESRLANVRERFRQEAKNGSKLSSPYIVKYLDEGEVEKNPFLVMERAEGSVGEDLKLGPLAREEAASIVAASLEGLEYLHTRGCPHRDVKPHNLLRFEHGFKLADLGIVKWNDFDPTFTRGGTITRASVQLGSWFYMAPEQQENPHEAVPASDVYSLGVSWIEMLTGTLPSPQAVGAQAFQEPGDDVAVQALIRRMVAYRPEARPSLAEISDVVRQTFD